MICFPLCYILWVSDLVADWMIRKMIFSLSFTLDLSQFQIERGLHNEQLYNFKAPRPRWCFSRDDRF